MEERVKNHSNPSVMLHDILYFNRSWGVTGWRQFLCWQDNNCENSSSPKQVNTDWHKYASIKQFGIIWCKESQHVLACYQSFPKTSPNDPEFADVNLLEHANATLKKSQERGQYLPTSRPRWNPKVHQDLSHLLFAWSLLPPQVLTKTFLETIACLWIRWWNGFQPKIRTQNN